MANKISKKLIHGFKGTDHAIRCRNFQFKLGEWQEVYNPLEIELCGNGFHFCEKFNNVLDHYSFDSTDKGSNLNRFFEVVGKDEYQRESSGNKIAVRKIKLVKELSKKEIFDKIFVFNNKNIELEVCFSEKANGELFVNEMDFCDTPKTPHALDIKKFIGFSRKLSKRAYNKQSTYKVIVKLERCAYWKSDFYNGSEIPYNARFVKFVKLPK